MEWSEFYRHFALYGFFLTLIFGAVLNAKTKNLDASTTSQLGASSKQNYLIFAVGLSSIATLLTFTVFGYLLQVTSIPSIFYVLYTITICLHLITAWVPDSKGWKKKVHFYSAYMMFYLYLTMVGLMWVDGYDDLIKGGHNVDGWMNYIGIVFALLMAFVGAYIHDYDRTNKQKLIGQQSYIIIFYMAVISRVYLGA